MSRLLSHHLALVARQSAEHRSPGLRRIHLLTNVLGWLCLMTALSALSPALAGGVVLGSVLYMAGLDALTALLLGAALLAWRLVVPWGSELGLGGGLLALLAFAAVSLPALPAHVFYHERAAWLGAKERGPALVAGLHVVLFGAFVFTTLALLDAGWRPRLRAALLQAERDLCLRRPGRGWQNWAGTHRSNPRDVFVPDTVDDVVSLVRANPGRKMRVVGSAFTWSPVIPCDDVLLFTERLDAISVDAQARELWCGPGAKNRALIAALEPHGLCLRYNVVLETVTAGGIVSVGTHGSGRDTGTMGDLLVAIELVDAAGQLRRYSEAETNPELWSALRASFGCFGVVVRLCFRVEPQRAWAVRYGFVPIAQTLAGLSTRLEQHALYELYWFPAQHKLWERVADPTDRPVTWRPRRSTLSLLNQLGQHLALRFGTGLVQRVAPRAYPRWMGVLQNFMWDIDEVMDNTDTHHYRQWVEAVPCGCVEVGFKIDPQAARVAESFAIVQGMVADWGARGSYPLDLTVNIRFIGESGALLSPAYGPGMTCYIEALCIGRPADWEAFSGELLRRWLQIETAMPHWPKELPQVEAVLATVHARHGARVDRFRAALEGSGVDPHGVFRNRFIQALLATPTQEASQRAG